MKTTLLILGVLLTLFSFLPLIRTPHWWIRILDFPRLHITVLLSAILLVFVWLYGLQGPVEMIMISLWGAAILNEMRYVFHFTPLVKPEALRSEQPTPQNAFSLMIANVRMVNQEYRQFLRLVLQENPDLLLMNEPNAAWYAHVRPELEKRYPYTIQKPLENTYGMLLWSKFALHESQIRYLVEEDVPSFYTVVELPGGKKFDLFTVHPRPPRLMQDTETREAELLLVAKQAKKTPYASVVAGDLNDVAWSTTTKLFKKISGMIDPRVGRGFYNTYNAHIPLFRYPLDHVFYAPDFRLLNLKRLPKFGSDHFPIVIRLNYEPQHQVRQEQPKAQPEEKRAANEMIQEGLEKGRAHSNVQELNDK